MKITEALLAEHVVFHNIFDHIERVLPSLKTVAEIKAFAALLTSLLTQHGTSEEEWIFAPLEHCLEQIGQSDTFEKEHREIDSSLADVMHASRLADARKLLLRAVLASRNHFDHEERIVFTLAEKVMKPDTLRELGRVWADQRKAT
ncbi:MAG: hemerythrin domain-containing protein [Verrucomicrobia bacterium]|nr:hemerythrin domain-containing protein [Verrucomicrobiota bacterium]